MSRKEFCDIIDRERGKVGFVLGLGPSLKKHLPYLKKMSGKKHPIISCNNIDVMTDIKIDYWMLAQPTDFQNPLHIPLAYERYNRMGAFFLYTDCLDLTKREEVESLLSVDYIGYDQRHFNSEKCGWKDARGNDPICCEGMIEGRLCIQEELQRYAGSDFRYGTGDTVGVHMIALGILLGLKEIYITGIDLDYSNGYVNNEFRSEEGKKALGMSIDERIKMGMDSINRSPEMVDRIIDDMMTLKKISELVGTKIYQSVSKKSRIAEVFEYKSIGDAI
jgi:hypothetical protein